MKLFDNFLNKVLKTDRNTFFTYILTLITIYLVVDRFIELLIMIFTGIASSYWGPIAYTLAFACPIFAFLFSGNSKFVKSDETKISFFYLYIVALYLLIISMITQWVNAACWFGLLSLPNYPIIATQYGHLIKPALCAIILYIPISTFYPIIMWLMNSINDSRLIRESIAEYKGISLAGKSNLVGPHTNEIKICIDKETGKDIKISEARRFDSMLVMGISGSGKTSMIFEPMIARDIDKKYYYQETSKELGFIALKTKIANLNCPYDNKYLNSNFNLNMLTPNNSRLQIFQSYMKKMIYNISGDNIIYRNLGLTYVAPDFESTSHVLEIAKAYKMKVNLIDPQYDKSAGLNPFSYENPLQTGIAISTVLKGLYNTNCYSDVELAYRENLASQAIENLSILLKEMYPKLHNNELPTLEDMLHMFNDFELIENMCEQLKEDSELSEKYSILLAYFKKNFYKDSINISETKKFITAASSQLDNLLRYPGIRNILCNRTNNLNYDHILENGEITLVCTRRGDLGATASNAFGLFFLLLMQYSVLKRPGTESTRIPHFLYIDEFSDYICQSTEALFTLYRKYKVGTIISAQNLDQLNAENKKFRKTILANCSHKIIFGNNTPEDNEWWSKELGTKRQWDYKDNYDTAKGEYDKKLTGISNAYITKFKDGKIQALGFKQCFYKVKNANGSLTTGIGDINFLESKYKESKTINNFNFEKFANAPLDVSTNNVRNKKSTLQSFAKDDNSEQEIDPIRLDNSDLKYNIEDENAISNLKKGNTN